MSNHDDLLVSKNIKANSSFYVDAAKGHTFKVFIETLATSLQRAKLLLTKEGIFLRQMNIDATMMFDASFPRINFREFKNTKKRMISFTLKHCRTQLKNVKKKDSVTLFISKDNPSILCIMIEPEGGKKVERSEINSIVIQDEPFDEEVAIPSTECYGFPKVINANDFQKTKKINNGGRIITITIQGDNYLSFSSDPGSVAASSLNFGKLTSDDDVESDEDAKDEDIEEEDNDQSQNSKAKTKEVYKSQFYTSLINNLVKLPGLCSQMQFYAPLESNYPLKIGMIAGQNGNIIGNIDVYIKNKAIIDYEASMVNNEEINQPIITTKPKSKRKKNTASS